MTMFALILRCIAFLLFVLAGCNQTVFDQPAADLVAFGLAAWVLSTLLFADLPKPTWRRGE